MSKQLTAHQQLHENHTPNFRKLSVFPAHKIHIFYVYIFIYFIFSEQTLISFCLAMKTHCVFDRVGTTYLNVIFMNFLLRMFKTSRVAHETTMCFNAVIHSFTGDGRILTGK